MLHIKKYILPVLLTSLLTSLPLNSNNALPWRTIILVGAPAINSVYCAFHGIKEYMKYKEISYSLKNKSDASIHKKRSQKYLNEAAFCCALAGLFLNFFVARDLLSKTTSK